MRCFIWRIRNSPQRGLFVWVLLAALTPRLGLVRGAHQPFGEKLAALAFRLGVREHDNLGQCPFLHWQTVPGRRL